MFRLVTLAAEGKEFVFVIVCLYDFMLVFVFRLVTSAEEEEKVVFVLV